jgi:multiple sugar transport system ATP-binding protein
MSFLRLHNLRKTFPDGTAAVKGVDLDIDDGEFIVLLGPSGCGKTTTLRMIAGLEIPTSGAITLAGADVTKLRPSQRDVGFVFQFYALYPHLSVRQNIAFPLESVGTSRAESARGVNEVAERVGIRKLLDLCPRQLSGGDQQRVALARAMVRRPRVWLMDEPLGTLDADIRLSLREFIRRQQIETKVTTMYVTHDQEEAMSLADRIVVMDQGVIRQVGSPEEVYDRPADLFVANFVGSPGMNLMRRGNETIGVRPEHVRIADDGIAATVCLSEYVGSTYYIHLETEMGRLIARSDDARERGSRVCIALDHTHHFGGDGKSA